MRFILSCELGRDVEAKRVLLRQKHLEYIREHTPMIVFGGPSLGEDGAPRTMTMVVEAADLATVRRFSEAEPYTAGGVFTRVEILRWAQVLPEPHAGTLDAEIAKEKAKSS